MTNFERIKGMDVEELTIFLYCIANFETEEQAKHFLNYHVNINDPSNKLYNSFKEWLESECNAE